MVEGRDDTILDRKHNSLFCLNKQQLLKTNEVQKCLFQMERLDEPLRRMPFRGLSAEILYEVTRNTGGSPYSSPFFFYPRPVLASGYYRCLCPSIRPSVRPFVTKFVRAINQHLFKLGSPNLDHRYKGPWLRSLLFGVLLTLTFKVKFNFKDKIYRILSLSVR